jgi:hypothetical protein
LENLGQQVEPALRKALRGQPSVEARRQLERLLVKLHGPVAHPELLRDLRAVKLLELIGSREARQVLHQLAQEIPVNCLTQEARAALARLAGQPGHR